MIRWLMPPLVWATGECFVSLFARRGLGRMLRELPVTFGLGWSLLFWFWLAGNGVLTLSFGWYGLAALALALTALLRKNTPETHQAPSLPWAMIDRGLLVLLLLAVVLVFAGALALPILDWDTRIIWGLKAKILAAEPTLIAEVFRDPYRLHIHPRYPLLLPWLGALVAGNGSVFSESAYQALLLFLGLLALWQFCRMVAGVAGRRSALVFGLILTLTGAWMQALFASSVEVALVYFLLVALDAVRRFLLTGHGSDLLAAGLLVSALALVKNEGLLLALALVVGCIAAGCSRSGLPAGLRRGGQLAVAALPVFAIWLVRMRGIPAVSDENYWQRLNPAVIAGGLKQSGILLTAVGSQAAQWSLWHLIWLLPVVILWRSSRRAGRASEFQLLTATMAVLYPSGILFAYILSPWRTLAMHVEVTFDRIMLPVLPLLLLLVASGATSGREPSEQRAEASSREG